MKEFKYLISSGCSFTEGHNLKEKGSWATYLAEKLNLEPINLSKGGSGNELITQKVINFATIHKKIAKNSLFVVQLSECLRYLIIYDNCFSKTLPYKNILWHISPYQFLEFDKDLVKKLGENGFKNNDLNFPIEKWIFENRDVLIHLFTNITFALSKTYDNIINFINFCESNDYEYIIFDGINNHIPIKDLDGKYYLKNSRGTKLTFPVEIFENKSKDLIKDLSFYKDKNSDVSINIEIINYLKSKDRYINDETLCEFIHEDTIYTDGNDDHPNEISSRIWADKILLKLKELKIVN